MLKKLVTLIMAVSMLAAPVCAATDVPVAPATGNAALLYSNDFEADSLETIVGEGANAKYWCLPSRVVGKIVSVNGNKAVSIYSPIGASNSGSLLMAQMGNLESQVTSGMLVYEARLMLPDVDPSASAKYAGGEATMSLNYYTISEECTTSCLFYNDKEHVEANPEHKGMGSVVSVSLNSTGFNVLSGDKQTVSTKIPFTVAADTWYAVKCLVNIDNKTFDLFCDGQLIATELPFCQNKKGVFGVGLGPVTNKITNVPAGYQIGTGEVLTEARNDKYGNPCAAYYDDVKLYTVSSDDAAAHIKAGFEALFKTDGLTGNVTLPYAGATQTWATTAGYSYAVNCDAVTLNENATTVISDPTKERLATVTRPANGMQDVTGTISFTKGSGGTALSHTIDIKVLAGETYLDSITPAEDGVEGYRAYEDFEGYNVGANRDNLTLNGIYANMFAVHKIVDTVNGEKVGSKALQMYHGNENASQAPRGAGINFSAPAKQSTVANAETDYVMLETDFMLPNVAPEGEAPYAGGEVFVSFGEYYCGDGGAAVMEDSIGEARTRLTIVGNRGDQKGYLKAYIANAKREAASEVKFPYFETNPHFDIQPDMWHKLRMVANLRTGQFDVYLDGKPAIIDAYFGKANLTEYILRSVFLGVPAPNTSAPVEVPAGYLLGDGTRAAVATTMPGNPFPVLYDNVQVSDITYDYNVEKITEGFETIVNEGVIASEAVELPYYGNTAAKDCHITYAVSAELANVVTINAPRDASTNNGDYGKRQYLAVTRGNQDVSGSFTVTYASGDAPEEDIEIPVTVKRIMESNAGIEAEAIACAKNGNDAEASALVINNSDGNLDAVMYVCTYKAGNQLSKIEWYPFTVMAGRALTFKKAITPEAGDVKMKAFVWTATGMKAISKGELPLS